jgi:hypothetical protein
MLLMLLPMKQIPGSQLQPAIPFYICSFRWLIFCYIGVVCLSSVNIYLTDRRHAWGERRAVQESLLC